MKLTCAQMDVLISFYIEGDLSDALKSQVEDHLEHCSTCRVKYDIVKSMIGEMQQCLSKEENKAFNTCSNFYNSATSEHYMLFKNNLSAYIDNELPTEDIIKIKKFAINNKCARKDLEDSYKIRKLLNNSFKKTKSEVKRDFSRSVMKQLELDEEANLGFHPAIKILIIFTLTVLITTTIVLFYLSG